MSKTNRKKQYSIAEARDQLTKLVHEAEEGTLVELTRRNEAVAVVISLQEYQQIRQEKGQFWTKLQVFREKVKSTGGIQEKDLEGLRDSTSGRNVEFER
jgi:prevent-host-death family protein